MNREFQEELAARTRQVEAVIEKYLPSAKGYQKTVVEAMNYSIQAGGKRLRPLLMWETYRMFGGRSEVIEPFMAAIEMIHTYSLVHDDLPAMDNDQYRRGKKTTHAQYGEAMGILAGDGLQTYAFETAAKAFGLEPSNSQIAKALSVLAQKAGVQGMLGGQCVDVEAEGKQMSGEMLTFIYRLKTGALLEASMLIGAVLAGATGSEQQQVEQAASELGLAFQIQDDILDVVSTTEELGKPVGSDEKNHKATWVTLFGIDEAKRQVERLSRQSVQRMNALVVRNEFLTSLMLELIHRKK
ncbi:polyprenyl synthetase family protein [Lachnospiraceae bacterium]|nr:polyprenyl synthetase family protein [Lachnospiraceae bacterium]